MKLGFVGAGDFAQAVAKRALKAAHEVLLSNSRGLDSVREIARQLGAGARAATLKRQRHAKWLFLLCLGIEWPRRLQVCLGGRIRFSSMRLILFMARPAVSHQ